MKIASQLSYAGGISGRSVLRAGPILIRKLAHLVDQILRDRHVLDPNNLAGSI